MAIWTSANKTTPPAPPKPLTVIEIIEQLKVGDWIYFNPSIYDCGSQYAIVTGVEHTEDTLGFKYRTLRAQPGDTDSSYSEMRIYVEENGSIHGVRIERKTVDDVIAVIANELNNIGPAAWAAIKAM